MARPSLSQPCPTYPLFEMMAGMLLCFAVVAGVCAACGTASAVTCRVDAVKLLPSDPERVTAGDVVDLVGRLKACEATGDAGARK